MKTLRELLETLPVINLRPSELHMTREESMITTLLGSCVAVCLYSRSLNAGAMCHCLLPYYHKVKAEDKPQEIFKYVNTSVAHMVEMLTNEYKIPRWHFKAKIFGGARVLENKAGSWRDEQAIGNKNIEAARASLHKHGIEIAFEKVGGDSGYKIFFHSPVGDVFIRPVPVSQFSDAQTRNRLDNTGTKSPGTLFQANMMAANKILGLA